MNSVVKNMLDKYDCKNTEDYKNALKEIIQEIALLGLYNSGFFKNAAFYGGSALRIFYGLNRFSEDIDFSLLKPDSNFRIEPYCDTVRNELLAYGFDMQVAKINKSVESNIESAFIKGGTLINLLQISSVSPPVSGVNKNEILKIKMEVDINPPAGADYEVKYSLNPIPYNLKLYTLPSLFAGKIHSLLCRKWKKRIKGRDFFDYVWFLSNNIKVNRYHLSMRMKQSGHLPEDGTLDSKLLLEMLIDKFNSVDFRQAKDDVRVFIKDQKLLNEWNKEFFIEITKTRLSFIL